MSRVALVTETSSAERRRSSTSLPLAALAAWAIGHLAVLAGSWYLTTEYPVGITDVLTAWDGPFYLGIVHDGYPSHLPIVDGHVVASNVAFFPGYPLLVRLVSPLTPFSTAIDALLVSALLSLAAVWLFALLVEQTWGAEAGRRAAFVIALFPGSFALSLVYSEALLLCAGAAALVFAGRRRWALAGIAGAVATAARPNGIEITAGLAVAAIVAWRERRAWQPAAAAATSALGIVGFLGYLWWQTGSAVAWFRTEHDAWGQSNDFGQLAVHKVMTTVSGRTLDRGSVTLALGAIATVGLLWLLNRMKPPPEVLGTAAFGAALTLSGNLGARPRLMLGVFPLLIPIAFHLKRAWFVAWCVASTMALTWLYVAYFETGQAGAWSIFFP